MRRPAGIASRQAFPAFLEVLTMLLETPRLLLRPFGTGDWAQVHAYARDPEVVRHLDWGPHTEADSRAFIARAMACDLQQLPHQRVHRLAAIFKPTGALVGDLCLKPGDPDPRSARLDCTLHRLAWGQGLGTELARELVDAGFRQFPLQRVWARCRPDNIGCCRVMKKAGLRFEEYFQDERTAKGEVVDLLRCGLTREDWLRLRPAG